jgi:DNA-binding winged helix-turn-helix (wHTH) protein
MMGDAARPHEVLPLLSFPPFVLDRQDERLWKGGVELPLRRKPLAVLRYLAENPLRLVRQDELVEAIWGKVAMSDSVLRSHIRALRQVLGEELVETVVGRGYRFRVDVHEMEIGSGPRAAANAGSLPTRASLVGRSAELAALKTALRAAGEGSTQLVFISGEAGVGKTTLLDAFLGGVVSRGEGAVARGSCVEQYGSGEAYLPVLEAVRVLCTGPTGERHAAILERHAPTWSSHLPALGSRGEAPQRATGQSHTGMLGEAAAALEAFATDQTLVLALDDLHWSDPSTVDLVAFLARRRGRERLLMIGTYRPADLARAHPLTRVMGELVAHKQATLLPLGTFQVEAVGEYLDERYVGHAFPPELAATVHRTTGGNPLFVAALLDELESRGMIRGAAGSYELATTVEDVAARRPDSIRRLLDVQLDRLDPDEQRILEAASVAGMTFTSGVVAHALSMAAEDVESHCESLASDRRLLRYVATEAWPDGTMQARYAFMHALYQHAALARAPSVRHWHRRIAERLESGYGEQAGAIAPELAGHFDDGQVFSRAAHYYILAGERALGRYGSFEALSHFERARALIDKLPAGRERDDLELRALRGLGPCLLRTSAFDSPAPVAALRRAAELATKLGRDEDLAAALLGLQSWRLVQGELREAAEHAPELAGVASTLSDRSLAESAARIATSVSFYRGRLREAEAGLARLSQAADDRGGHPIVVFRALDVRLHLAWLAGRLDRALEMGRRELLAAEAGADPWWLTMALTNLARVCLWRREPQRVLAYSERALDLATDGHYVLVQAMLALLVCWAGSQLDSATAGARLDDFLSKRPDMPRTGRTQNAPILLDVCVRAGRPELARELLADAMTQMERGDERFLEAELLRMQGELLAASEPAQAELTFMKAIDVARHQGARALELRAASSLVRVAEGPRRTLALSQLRRILESFEEGFETGDLRDAQALLDDRP